MRAFVMLACLGACGRVGFEASNALESTDASPTPRVQCWDRWTTGTLVVGEPRKLAELGAGKFANPSISADGTTLYVERIDADEDVFTSTRSIDGEWTTAARLEALASTARDGRFSTSGDGMLGVFTSNRSGNADLWTTQRSAPGGAFGEPTQALVMALKTPINELDPELTMDGTRIYYAPYSNGMQDIRFARRDPGSAFGFVRVLSELQLSSAVADPALSPDETVIAFSSGATGDDNDLYYATRPHRDATFGKPVMIPRVNIAPDINDGDIDLSSDGCEIYFMSNRGGTQAVYLATVDN